MRTRDSLPAIIALTLAAAGCVAVGWSAHYPQALRAEATGFDALARTVFGPALAQRAPATQTKEEQG